MLSIDRIDECEHCGAELDDHAIDALTIARAARAGAEAAIAGSRTVSGSRERGRNPVAGILSARAAARRLGIGRDTLARLEQAREITSVPKGLRRGFRAADVEALIERGYKLPGALPRPALAKRKRRRRSETDDAAVQAKLAEF
jgi:hypothetical protein